MQTISNTEFLILCVDAAAFFSSWIGGIIGGLVYIKYTQRRIFSAVQYELALIAALSSMCLAIALRNAVFAVLGSYHYGLIPAVLFAGALLFFWMFTTVYFNVYAQSLRNEISP
ncbi:MAG: hypothetical protein AAB343_00690 [Patescibacteria group bacterium]